MTDNIEIPDFSGDDLGHHKEVQQSRAERKAYEQMVNDSIHILKTRLSLTDSSHKNLKPFLMFNSLQPMISKSFKSSNPNTPLHVSLVEYESSFPIARGNNSGSDEYLFGYFTLSQTFPKTYACKETLREKITDLLLRSDVDFDHSRTFSGKFHVVTEDKNRLLNLMQLKNLNNLVSFPDMEFELIGNTCLFRNSKRPVSSAEAIEFAELAVALKNTLI